MVATTRTTERTGAGTFDTVRKDYSDGTFKETVYKETSPGVMGTSVLRGMAKVSERTGKTRSS